MIDSADPARRGWLAWIAAATAVAGVVVVVVALATSWAAVVHGHPAYAVVLAVTALVSILALVLALRRTRRRRGAWRAAGRVALIVLGAGWIAAVAWLQPHAAVEPALTAMASDAAVTVTETTTDIVLAPADGAATTGVFFQPGALVDARAYAAVLRPLADAGIVVVIPKQPLGIAFLAIGAFDDASAAHPEVTTWVLGGHSLGGTVAALEAQGADPALVAGLLLFASYPADDMSDAPLAVLSISGSQDGLATPAKIEASRASLPAGAEFLVVDGASHAQFGAYGPQAGDGVALISDADAREQISAATVAFVASIAG